MNANGTLALQTCLALWRRPGFLIVASLTLSLGMASLVAAATLVDALLIGPPPFAAPCNIVVYGQQMPGDDERILSPAAFNAIGMPAGAVARGMVRVPATVNVVLDGHASLARARRIDPGFLATLGIAGRAEGAWVSSGFWAREAAAGRDPRAATLDVDGQRMTVAGVLPPAFRFLEDVDMLLPWSSAAPMEDRAANVTAIARLGNGVPLATLADGVRASVGSHPAVLLPTDRLAAFGATPLGDAASAASRKPVLLFLACALVQLAIAGMNTSNLMRSRSLARAYDLGMRELLGASQGAGWIPASIDACVLWCVATLGGTALGALLLALLFSVVPDAWRVSALPLAPSTRACLLAAGICLVVVVASTVASTVRVQGADVVRARLAMDGWRSAGGIARCSRGVVVLVQTALATLLLLPAVTSSMRLGQLQRQPPGFDSGHALAIELSPDAREFPRRSDIDALFRNLLPTGTLPPGVQYAGFSSRLPVGTHFVMQFIDADGARAMYQYATMTPGAGEAMGLHKVAGRWLGEGDDADAEPVAMVNQAYVDAMKGQGVGYRAEQASRLFATRPLRIVGVVANTRHAGAANPPAPTVFVPFAQVSEASFAYIRDMMPMYAVFRGPAVDGSLATEFGRRLRQVAPHLALGQRQMLSSLQRSATDEPRRMAALMALFALPAVFLAGVGLYSVHSIEVGSRKRDIALREALGATVSGLLAMTLRRAMSMAWLGTAIGLVLTLLGRAFWLRDDVHPTAVVVSLSTMLLVSVFATLAPAWHVLSIETHCVLRGET